MEKDDLFLEIRAILNGISDKVLKAEFPKWEKWLPTCIDAKGEFVE
jgi:hypothetical protein